MLEFLQQNTSSPVVNAFSQVQEFNRYVMAKVEEYRKGTTVYFKTTEFVGLQPDGTLILSRDVSFKRT